MFSCFVNMSITWVFSVFRTVPIPVSGAVLAKTSTQVLSLIQCCSQSRVNLDSVAVTSHGQSNTLLHLSLSIRIKDTLMAIPFFIDNSQSGGVLPWNPPGKRLPLFKLRARSPVSKGHLLPKTFHFHFSCK